MFDIFWLCVFGAILIGSLVLPIFAPGGHVEHEDPSAYAMRKQLEEQNRLQEQYNRQCADIEHERQRQEQIRKQNLSNAIHEYEYTLQNYAGNQYLIESARANIYQWM